MKPYVCSGCDREFDRSQDLGRHRFLEHPDEARPGPCPVCGQQFAVKQRLRVHLHNAHPASKVRAAKAVTA